MASPPTEPDGVRLRRRALPEGELAAVSLRTHLLGRPLQAPLIVSDARAAAEHGLALVVRARPDARPPLLIAELATVGGRDALWRAAELIEELDADALAIRLHPLEEAVRAETVTAVVGHVSPTPVLVTGATDFEDVVLLREAGVAAVGVDAQTDLMTDARAAAPELPLIVSGVRDGTAVAKCIALGATACAVPSEDVGTVVEQLQAVTWLTGAGGVHELGRQHLR